MRASIEERNLGPILAPQEFDDAPIFGVHDRAFVGFLTHAYDEWRRDYPDGTSDALPSAWPVRGMRQRREGQIEAKLGSYGFDTASPITRGTWQAARMAANTALTAAQTIAEGERAVFALTRPPGHHAAHDLFGGYCYLNNVAIAAQFLTDRGLRSAVLDVDYHHGNGTQAIFYGRDDVLFVSIHADPSFAFPHFSGFADEKGEGAGEGFNLNLPLPAGTTWPDYSNALDPALSRIADFAPDVLLVSLGLDTFERDPISAFKLKSEDYLRMGRRISASRRPTLFAFEGGYNVEALGEITANVLEGFESGI